MPTSKKLILGTLDKELAARLLKDAGRELAGAIRAALPPDYAYFVILNGKGSTAFFSDADRAEAIRLLRDVLSELEGD